MDGLWIGNAFFYFSLCLPISLVAWTGIVRCLGWLGDTDDQPSWFWFIAVRSPFWDTGATPVLTALGSAVFVWAVGNFVPVLALVFGTYGPLDRVGVLVYFVVQGVFVLQIRRAIMRARSGEEGS